MLSDFDRARLDAHHAASRAAELGLSPQDIASMPWDEYNRLFHPGRQTPVQAALNAIKAPEPNFPQYAGLFAEEDQTTDPGTYALAPALLRQWGLGDHVAGRRS